MTENLYPHDSVDLPSSGWFYPVENPLSSGKIDLYFMTAKHEDILSSRSLILKGTVLDRLLQALIVDKGINFDDLLVGDKNGLMVAARIGGYGKDYPVSLACPSCGTKNSVTIDLEKLEFKKIDLVPEQKGKNEFLIALPVSKKVLTFKLLTHKDEREVTAQIESLKKISGAGTMEVTTRMKKCILSVDGDVSPKTINETVDKMLAKDSMAFREYVKKVNPDIELKFDFTCSDCAVQDRLEVPIDINFFWPNATT